MWSSQLDAEERHVPEATTLLPDSRARHFWDPDRLVGLVFGKATRIGGAAWDFWLLFDREALWPAEGAPRIAWWEHQLRGLPPERRLDAVRFADRALELQGSRVIPAPAKDPLETNDPSAN